MLSPNRTDVEKVYYHPKNSDLPRKAPESRRRGPPLFIVAARVWELIYELGGTREKPCWLKLAEMLEKTTGVKVNRGALMQVAVDGKESNKVRLALGLSKDQRSACNYYRPRYSPARMRAVLASPAAQQELLAELLAEFEKRVRET